MRSKRSIAEAAEARDAYISLARAYLTDRAVMNLTHPPPAEDGRCRYCGGAWQHYPHSEFDGHVRCMVSLPFQQRVVAFFDDNPSATYANVALALGVTYSVVKAWWSNVKMPRRSAPPAATSSEGFP